VNRLVHDGVERIEEHRVAEGAEPHRNEPCNREPRGDEEQREKFQLENERATAEVRGVAAAHLRFLPDRRCRLVHITTLLSGIQKTG